MAHRVFVVFKPGLTIVGIKVRAPLQQLSTVVPRAWQRLMDRLKEIAHKVDPQVFYGVFPEADQRHDGDAEGIYTYWVGTEVENVGDLPEGLECIAIPPQVYASTTAKGSRVDIAAAYTALAAWLDKNGRTTDDMALGFERYDTARQSVLAPDSDFDFDIYKPLEPTTP